MRKFSDPVADAEGIKKARFLTNKNTDQELLKELQDIALSKYKAYISKKQNEKN